MDNGRPIIFLQSKLRLRPRHCVAAHPPGRRVETHPSFPLMHGNKCTAWTVGKPNCRKPLVRGPQVPSLRKNAQRCANLLCFIDECTREDLAILIEAWRRHDNIARLHSYPGYKPPAPKATLPAADVPPDSAVVTARTPPPGDRQAKKSGGSLPKIRPRSKRQKLDSVW